MMKQCDVQNCSSPVFSHKKCKKHQYLREDYKPYKYEKKATGEGKVMDKIISARKHISFLSGQEINPCTYSNCAHVVPKGDASYERFSRLDPDNIILLTQEEHTLYDQGTIKQRELYAIKHGCDWNRIQDIYDKLIEKYERLKEQEKYGEQE